MPQRGCLQERFNNGIAKQIKLQVSNAKKLSVSSTHLQEQVLRNSAFTEQGVSIQLHAVVRLSQHRLAYTWANHPRGRVINWLLLQYRAAVGQNIFRRQLTLSYMKRSSNTQPSDSEWFKPFLPIRMNFASWRGFTNWSNWIIKQRPASGAVRPVRQPENSVMSPQARKNCNNAEPRSTINALDWFSLFYPFFRNSDASRWTETPQCIRPE